MLIGYKDKENDTHTSTLSVKSMMEAVGLKNRPNFMDYSLTPAIREGFVCTVPHLLLSRNKYG